LQRLLSAPHGRGSRGNVHFTTTTSSATTSFPLTKRSASNDDDTPINREKSTRPSPSAASAPITPDSAAAAAAQPVQPPPPPPEQQLPTWLVNKKAYLRTIEQHMTLTHARDALDLRELGAFRLLADCRNAYMRLKRQRQRLRRLHGPHAELDRLELDLMREYSAQCLGTLHAFGLEIAKRKGALRRSARERSALRGIVEALEQRGHDLEALGNEELKRVAQPGLGDGGDGGGGAGVGAGASEKGRPKRRTPARPEPPFGVGGRPPSHYRGGEGDNDLAWEDDGDPRRQALLEGWAQRRRESGPQQRQGHGGGGHGGGGASGPPKRPEQFFGMVAASAEDLARKAVPQMHRAAAELGAGVREHSAAAVGGGQREFARFFGGKGIGSAGAGQPGSVAFPGVRLSPGIPLAH
jgi:hypothetical protein